MAKKTRLSRRPPRASHHLFPPQWRQGDWLVPFDGDYACFYHGHQSADDHSLCGPQLFCCARSLSLCQEHYPDILPPQTHVAITPARHLQTWLTPQGPNLFYFYACDPTDPARLWFLGLPRPALSAVLWQHVPLEHYLSDAIRIV